MLERVFHSIFINAYQLSFIHNHKTFSPLLPHSPLVYFSTIVGKGLSAGSPLQLDEGEGIADVVRIKDAGIPIEEDNK
jgi:hypothetical protein